MAGKAASKAPSPTQMAAEVYAQLGKLRDDAKARSLQRFFKEPVASLGVDAPTLRKLAREWYARVKPHWGREEAICLCERLLAREEIEARMAGILILGRFRHVLEPRVLSKCKLWLGKHCDNWALVDGLCSTVLSPLIEDFPELARRVLSWVSSRTLWVRRGAPVSLVPHAGKGRHLDVAYEVAGRLLGDGEDLVHKAVGWLLREAGKCDPGRLEAFLLAHGPDVPRTTVRYAIEKLPDRKRRQLLEKTQE